MRDRLLFLALLAAALLAEELLYRLLVAPRADASLFAWAAPWLPAGLCVAWHGARLQRLREVPVSAAAGALLLMAADALQAVAGGAAQARQLVLEQPLRWAAVSLPLWSCALGLVLAIAYGARRGLSRAG